MLAGKISLVMGGRSSCGSMLCQATELLNAATGNMLRKSGGAKSIGEVKVGDTG